MNAADNEIPSQTDTASAPDPRPEELTGSRLFWACFWCLPLGMYAVYLAGQIDARAARGDTSGAAEVGANALRWANIAMWLGIGLTVFFLLVMCNAPDTSTTTY